MLTVICLPHAEDVSVSAARRVTDDYHPAGEHAEKDDSTRTVVPARVFDLDRRPLKDDSSVREIQSALEQGALAFARVEGDAQLLL